MKSSPLAGWPAQPQAVYFRFEKGGLTLDNQPVPWSAEAVVVEALLRLPPAARRRGRLHSCASPASTRSRPRSCGRRGRPAPPPLLPLPRPEGDRHGRADVEAPRPRQRWRSRSSPPSSSSPSCGWTCRRRSCPSLGRSVAAQTFVSTQQQGLDRVGRDPQPDRPGPAAGPGAVGDVPNGPRDEDGGHARSH